ncbi:hypothetical protein SpCBS45565_g06816 [Spizellomyces sp. 'palustris']|nr:hypothetical protein SpCBS45565_g06816 [Spizellomyces sp. 'palustris']
MTSALTRTSGRVTRRRDPTTAHLTPSSSSNHKPGVRDIYAAALRCCIVPALDSGIDKQPSRTSGDYQRGAFPASNGGGERSFADEARRAAEKLGLHVHVGEYGEASVNEGGTVRLAAGTLKSFRKLLAARVEIFRGAMKDPRTGTFARAGGRFLRERLVENFNPALLSDVKDLILCIGAYIDKELPKELSPEDHDKYLFLTAELFMAVIREAIQKAEPRSTVLSNPVLKEQDQLKVVLRTFLRIVPITGDSIMSSLSEWVRVVFELKKDEHYQCVAEVRKTCTEKSTFAELKAYLDAIVKDDCPGARVSDFQSRQAYEAWKQRETQLLQVVMQTFYQRFPNTIKNRASSAVDATAFLPADPRLYYRTLLEICLKHDLQSPAKQDNAISLSKLSVAVLSECSLRWRLSKEFKDIAILDVLVTYYRLGLLIEDDLFPRFNQISKMSTGVNMWRVADRHYYISVLESLNAALHDKLRQFAGMLGWKEKTPDGCNTTLRDDKAWQSEHPEWTEPGKLEELVREELLEAINARYKACSALVSGLSREIIRLTTSVKAVNSDITNYRLYFREPIFGLSIMLIAAETCLKYFILEMENMRFSLQGDFQIAEMLELYQVVKLLRDMCEESEMPIVKNFDVESWFAPFISQWLTLTDQKWLEWVKSAVGVEKYEPYMPPVSMHSTSVMDIFTCFYGGLEFIEKLAWRESAKKDRLVKDFIKMMSKSLQEYAQMMWDEFEQIDNDNADKPLVFSYQSCIKINNLVAAHMKLKDILSKLVASNGGRRKIDMSAPRTEPEKEKSTISIKIIRAANLQACDWTTSDPYVVLSHAGGELHRTRVIDKNLNPAWNQTFQLYVPHSLRDNESFLDLLVYDKDIIGKDDLCGEAGIFLRDSKFEDFLSHGVELSLKPQGKLFIRVMRKGEIDDVEFWVRKAEESVRFCLEDMVRVYSEQITRVARSTFSHVLSSGTTKSLWGIPLSLGSHSTSAIPTLEGVQAAIRPFLDYLDQNLGLFNETLDRHLNEYLIEFAPALAPPKKIVHEQIMKRTQTRAGKRGQEVKTMSRKEASKPSSSGAGGPGGSDAVEEELNRPSAVIKLVWYELLHLIEDTLSTFGADDKNKEERRDAALALRNRSSSLPDGPVSAFVAPGVIKGNKVANNLAVVKLSTTEKRAIMCYDLIVEILKAIFTCEVDGVVCGYEVGELEEGRYQQVRKILDGLVAELRRLEIETK